MNEMRGSRDPYVRADGRSIGKGVKLVGIGASEDGQQVSKTGEPDGLLILGRGPQGAKDRHHVF